MRNDGEWKWNDQPNEFPSVACWPVNNFHGVPNSLSLRETETETSDEEMEERKREREWLH
jgi:hypothetical protein